MAASNTLAPAAECRTYSYLSEARSQYYVTADSSFCGRSAADQLPTYLYIHEISQVSRVKQSQFLDPIYHKRGAATKAATASATSSRTIAPPAPAQYAYAAALPPPPY